MATLKPAYLIHGDDHGRIAERRARLRALAERESGSHGIEIFEGEAATSQAVAAALDAMTFVLGRRVIIVDGAERWKEGELDRLELSLKAIAPETTVAFFAREEVRFKAPKRLHDAVRSAGGDVVAEDAIKPWELPKWATARARELGVSLDAEAARALVAHVGERQQRLLRELEKLALELGVGARIDADQVGELTAASAELRVWSLADAVVRGDPRAATRSYLALRAQGERLPGLLYSMAQRIRTAHDIAVAVAAGEPAARIKGKLRMPSRVAARLIEDARNAGAERLREALEQLADLELASRGGGGALGEETTALLAIQRMAGS